MKLNIFISTKLNFEVKPVFIIIAICIMFVFAFANDFVTPVHFDFGAKNSKVKSGALLVTENTIYNKKNGFGLIQPETKSFLLFDHGLKNDLTIDGISSDKPINFRVDLSPGNYWIEIFLAGGGRSLWTGEIRANDFLLADSLFNFSVSFEGENPPVYWTILRKTEIKKNSLVLSISAATQMNTLTGISIYKNEIGPIRLTNGKLQAKEKLQAPNASMVLDLINKGAPNEAQRLIDQIPEEKYRYEKALLLLSLAGRLEIRDPRIYIDLTKKLLEQEFEKEKRDDIAFNLRLAELYTEGDTYYKMGGWDWAKYISGKGIFDRQNTAGHLLKKISEVKNHPLHFRAIWYIGTLSFHAWAEQHNRWQKNNANKCFSYLKPYYPNLRLLKIYSGEQLLPEKIEATRFNNNFPNWVNETNLALNSLVDVIHYWVDFRQAENGEFGGKFDDDVEMLRWWPIARLVQNDEKTLLGLRRLVNGIWNSEWITNGFSTEVRDVEHAAEPVADTQPMMIGLDYGNPIYVERCMESVKGLRDVWTGINKKGHRHFKSSWYSYNKIDTRPPKNCDLEMNVRTVKAALWLAWYNRHPFAMQFMKEWCDAWLEDCLRTDKGKPYGIVPAAIRFEDDAIGGHADNWHHPAMFWHYFNFSGGIKMLKMFLAMYNMTGEKKYLEPIEEAIKLVQKYEKENTKEAEVGSQEWVAGILKNSPGFAKTMEIWRLLTNDTKYDDLLQRFGSAYLKFRLSGDKKYLFNGSKKVTDGILYNRELITTEGYFTDRINIGNANEGTVLGASHLESMFLGGALHNGFFPFYSVSWNGFGENFVSAVLNSDQKSVNIEVHNLSEQNKIGSVFFWTLSPGSYECIQGTDEDRNDVVDKVQRKEIFDVVSQVTSFPVTLPPQSTELIQVRQLKPKASSTLKAVPDLAITKSELNVEEKKDQLKIKVLIHNIGIAMAENVSVKLMRMQNSKIVLIDRKVINSIEAPLDLEPKVKEVTLSAKKLQYSNGEFIIVIDHENQIQEITEINNKIFLNLLHKE